jgi:hypothetical protein
MEAIKMEKRKESAVGVGSEGGEEGGVHIQVEAVVVIVEVVIHLAVVVVAVAVAVIAAEVAVIQGVATPLLALVDPAEEAFHLTPQVAEVVEVDHFPGIKIQKIKKSAKEKVTIGV